VQLRRTGRPLPRGQHTRAGDDRPSPGSRPKPPSAPPPA
jgi:hypothetical protein